MDRDTITATRMQVWCNGYTPLPNVDKMCLLTGWPTVEVTEDEIALWGRMKYEATGLRLQDGLCAIDFDIDHPKALELYDALLDHAPKLHTALFRQGKGYKEAWFVRVSDPFPRIAGPIFKDPSAADEDAEGLRVEVFGGGSHRQFGALGWHTKDELEYQWLDGGSPETVPLANLPVFTEEEITDLVTWTSIWMEREGFVVHSRSGEGRTDPHEVYDLVPEMRFITQRDGEAALDDLRDLCGGGGHYYCAASFTDGPIARNRRRCSVSIDRHGGVAIWDSMTDITHHEARFEVPALEDVPQEVLDDVRERLERLGAAAAPPDVVIDNRWREMYLLTENGAIRQNESNAALALSTDDWEGVLSYSEFDHGGWVLAEMPGDHRSLPHPRRITDADFSHILTWLQHDQFPSITPAKVKTAVGIASMQNTHHAPRDYLDGVTWDGTDRLTHYPLTYLGTTVTDADAGYVRAIWRKWIISAVARIYRPGCKADHMIVLQGPQGAGKSTMLEILGGAWFGDDMPPVGHKDAKEWIRDQWIAEIAELGALSGRDVEHVKAFLTTRTDKFRKAYGSVVETVPRQVVFAGSTNDSEYLFDTTGGRRFWPLQVGKIDLAAVRGDRDQIWAEAVAAYRAGEVWHIDADLDPEAHLGSQHAQETARVRFMEEEPIQRWLRSQKAEEGLLSYDVAVGALRVDTAHMPPVLQHRVPRIMSMLGWEKARRTKLGATWMRGPEAEPFRIPDVTSGTKAERAAKKASMMDLKVIDKEGVAPPKDDGAGG